jgi:uncharacterized membrane protein YeaQ/YmgE (transglycosylase-associated protein family)
MFLLLSWILFGFFVGIIAKIIHPGDEPVGCLPTILIGVFGSFVGGFLNSFLHHGRFVIAPSGFLMSILGGILTCVFWRWYTLKFSSTGPKNFFNGKQLR